MRLREICFESKEDYDRHQELYYKNSIEFLHACHTQGLLTFPASEELDSFLAFYSRKLIDLTEFFKYPAPVWYSSVLFFRRFYSVQSPLNYHPKDILVGCFFLGCKVENHHLDSQELVKFIKNVEEESIYEMEILVVKTLDYHLLTSSPFTPLYGYCLLHQDHLDNPEDIYQKSIQYLKILVLSDLVFLTNMKTVALMAFVLCCEARDIQMGFLGQEFDRLSELRPYITPPHVNNEQLRQIDETVSNHRNPAYSPGTNLYQQLQTMREQKDSPHKPSPVCVSPFE